MKREVAREQLSLFGHHFVGSRHKRPKGDLTKMPRTGSKRLVVLRAIATAGKRGITDEEMGMKLVLSPSDIAKARLELIDGFWVEDGQVRRKTSFGDDTIVWRLTPQGEEKWAAAGLK